MEKKEKAMGRIRKGRRRGRGRRREEGAVVAAAEVEEKADRQLAPSRLWAEP